MTERITPAEAWAGMVRGNERFVAGEPAHPRQDVERRAEVADGQAPDVALFGCSDSRLAAEIIFDKGLGDLFVVRNAGQVVSESVLASLEYAVQVLHVPLIVVLAHDACGAVQAAIDAAEPDAAPLPPHIAAHIAPIAEAVERVPAGDDGRDPVTVGLEHLRDTVRDLVAESELLSDAVAAGTLAIVGANYRLREGRVVPDVVLGSIES
jgi:carbonic anhydrase